MNMKKFLAMLLALCMVLSMAACGTTGSSAEAPASGAEAAGSTGEAAPASSDGEVAVFWYTNNDTYLSSVRSAMNAALDAASITYNDYDANGSQTTQTDAVDTAIAKGASLLVVNLVDSGSADAAQAIADKAKAANIPLIFFNRSIADTDEAAQAIIDGHGNACYVGTEYTQAGTMQGDMIGQYLVDNFDAVDLNGDGSISYVMFKGDEGNLEAIARTQYGRENANIKLKDAGKPELVYYDANVTDPEKQYLVDQNGAWSSQAATDYMQTILSQYSEANKNMVELVIANNDEMALGAISALQNAGYNNGEGTTTIPVFGVDATDAAKDAIGKGTMTGTIKQDAEGMANAIVTIVKNMQAGSDKFADIDASQMVGTWRVNIPYAEYTGE